MFQYAAGLALAERRRTVLKLDISWYREYAEYEAHNRYALSCFNITEQFATAEEIDRVRGVRLSRPERWLTGLARVAHLRRLTAQLDTHGNFYHPASFAFDPAFFSQPDNTYVQGMFQSEQFFASVADLLRVQFSLRYPPQPGVAAMAERIRSGPSAAVHFRRGDYTRNKTFAEKIGVLGLDYYHHAVACIRERSPHAMLYVFSDDIEAVAREFKPEGPHEFVRCVKPWHAYDKLWLMSLCEHIAIANSTFSWWAAWLNPSPAKLVIAPDPWFKDSSLFGADLVPTHWARLASYG